RVREHRRVEPRRVLALGVEPQARSDLLHLGALSLGRASLLLDEQRRGNSSSARDLGYAGIRAERDPDLAPRRASVRRLPEPPVPLRSEIGRCRPRLAAVDGGDLALVDELAG